MNWAGNSLVDSGLQVYGSKAHDPQYKTLGCWNLLFHPSNEGQLKWKLGIFDFQHWPRPAVWLLYSIHLGSKSSGKPMARCVGIHHCHWRRGVVWSQVELFSDGCSPGDIHQGAEGCTDVCSHWCPRQALGCQLMLVKLLPLEVQSLQGKMF